MTKPSNSEMPWRVFAVTVAAGFMVALDLSIVNVAFPSIRSSFADVSPATLSWVLAAYSVVFGRSCSPPDGSPTDQAAGGSS